jgi:hypothetical protein
MVPGRLGARSAWIRSLIGLLRGRDQAGGGALRALWTASSCAPSLGSCVAGQVTWQACGWAQVSGCRVLVGPTAAWDRSVARHVRSHVPVGGRLGSEPVGIPGPRALWSPCISVVHSRLWEARITRVLLISTWAEGAGSSNLVLGTSV